MMAQFASGLTDKFSKMTTDETIEWLYRLFFRERAVEEVTEEYIPNIIYNRTYKKGVSSGAIAAAVVVVAAAAAVGVVFWRRKRAAA